MVLILPMAIGCSHTYTIITATGGPGFWTRVRPQHRMEEYQAYLLFHIEKENHGSRKYYLY